MRKKTTAYLFYVGISALLFLQTTTAQITTKTNVFKPEDLPKTPEKKADLNCAKFGITEITRGLFSFSYEHVLKKNLSIEATAGLTVFPDYIFLFSGTEKYEQSITASSSIDMSGSSYSPGPALGIGCRFYPDGIDNFDNAYIEPELVYRKYFIDLPTGAPPLPLGYNFTDLRLRFGYIGESLFWDGFLSDFYIGVSYRNVTIDDILRATDNNGKEIYMAHSKSYGIPQIIFGTKIGLPF